MIIFKAKTYENRFQQGLFATSRRAVQSSVSLANRAFKENIGLRDHSLSALAKLDHPYAARHGKQGKPIHMPYWKVHKQSGGLASSGVMEPIIIETSDSVVGNFGFDGNNELARHIVFGTSNMIPRPVVAGSLTQVKTKIKGIFKQEFHKRYQARIKSGI